MSLRAYVDQYDTVHMLRLLGGDLTKFGKSVAHSHFAPSIRGYRNKKNNLFLFDTEKNKFQDKRDAVEAQEDDEQEANDDMVADDAESAAVQEESNE